MMSTFKYKHKSITFPEEVKDNYFLVNVKNNYSRLLSIYDMEVSYIPSDYPTLINTFEQLYKGVCKELLTFHTDMFRKSDEDYQIGHRFSAFGRIIDHYIPLSVNKEGYDKVIENCKRLESLYNSTRYEKQMSFEEFQMDFRRLEAQIERLMIGLSKEYKKSVITAEVEDDLQYY